MHVYELLNILYNEQIAYTNYSTNTYTMGPFVARARGRRPGCPPPWDGPAHQWRRRIHKGEFELQINKFSCLLLICISKLFSSIFILLPFRCTLSVLILCVEIISLLGIYWPFRQDFHSKKVFAVCHSVISNPWSQSDESLSQSPRLIH
jgi:hypothetical protein